MHIEETRPLAPFTTFGIGGPARWFVEAASEPEIVEAVAWARERSVPLFVLGGGSNLLISDAGFDGLVLRVVLRGISVVSTDDSVRVYRVTAGESWDGFVQRSVDDNCAGIECLAGIPGTVGGTPVQNVGAYGQEVASVIECVRAFDLQAHAFAEFTAAECDFAYRRSRFNSTDRGRFLITSVDYGLNPGGAPTLHYLDLKQEFQQSCPSVSEVAATVRRIRRSKGMLLVDGDPDCRSVGSFFKNPVITEEHANRIASTSATAPVRFPAGPGKVKLPAAWLIEQAGFHKGYAAGAAGISSRHTLALVNRGGATAAEILELATQIADAVETRFGIHLEMEPMLVGFNSHQAG
jgi:UDP-N-acetylmuramate dehydrogenase